MGILSIQSQVACGYVGNSAAVLALQALRREVWPLPTVLLSHHPGHGGARGGPMPVALLESIFEGLASRHCFSRCEAVLSGYLGQAEAANVVRAAVVRARAGTPGAIYLCDPVLGDDGRFYVSDEIVAAMRGLAAIADIVTPNAFELGVLSGAVFDSRQGALQAMRGLRANGPEMVLLTSFGGIDTPPGTLDVMALDGAAAWCLNVRNLQQQFRGAGDLFAAIFLDAWLTRRDVAAAFGKTCSALQAVLARTALAQADELMLIECQHLLVTPDVLLVPEQIA
jgi:pyridoxine kinase